MSVSVSFIIPFYNGGATIQRCLNSIYSIGMKEDEYEIVIVDDCSPIPAELVLADFSHLHSNLKIIRHDVNKRQGGAKNTGIRVSSGKYLVFADQDDYIIPNNLFTAIHKTLISECDMCACRFFIVSENETIKEVGANLSKETTTTGKCFCESYFDAGSCLAPWSYIYRREFLLSLSHPMEENVLMEDSDWVAWHLFFAERIMYLPIPIYCWVMNPSSITHCSSYQHKADWVKFGYRKIRDSKEIAAYSSLFAQTMENDGKYNIECAFRKLWKTDSYFRFYNHIGQEVTREIRQMHWSKQTSFMISFPFLSASILSIVGPPLKAFRSLIRQ